MVLDVLDADITAKLRKLPDGVRYRLILDAPRDSDCWPRVFGTLAHLFPQTLIPQPAEADAAP